MIIFLLKYTYKRKNYEIDMQQAAKKVQYTTVQQNDKRFVVTATFWFKIILERCLVVWTMRRQKTKENKTIQLNRKNYNYLNINVY